MNIVGIIPARGGSKRIPRKNIKMLAGKPLVAWTIDAALKSKYINKVVVSTEDQKIATISEKFGAQIIKRPSDLAVDTTKTAPVLLQVVEELEKQNYYPDIVVLLQCTSPLRDENIIDSAVEMLLNSDRDSVFTGHFVCRTMPLWKKHHDNRFRALYDYHLRPRSQEPELNEEIYTENGALYAIKTDAFKKYKDFIGENPDIYLMDRVIDIDTEEDFKAVEDSLLNK